MNVWECCSRLANENENAAIRSKLNYKTFHTELNHKSPKALEKLTSE
jgi:hypothetical protein